MAEWPLLRWQLPWATTCRETKGKGQQPSPLTYLPGSSICAGKGGWSTLVAGTQSRARTHQETSPFSWQEMTRKGKAKQPGWKGLVPSLLAGELWALGHGAGTPFFWARGHDFRQALLESALSPFKMQGRNKKEKPKIYEVLIDISLEIFFPG